MTPIIKIANQRQQGSAGDNGAQLNQMIRLG